MQMDRRSFLAGAAGVAATGVLAGCGGGSGSSAAASGSAGSAAAETSADYTLVEDGKLTLISNFTFPPFVFADEETSDPSGYKGCDVDVAGALADKLGLELNILPTVQFDTIVPTIKQGGKADVSLGGITITDERKKEIDFSNPYIDSNQSIVFKSDYADPTVAGVNAAGKKIAVQGGTTGESWAQENIPEATVVPLDDIIQCMTGVQTGAYDACVSDLPVTQYMISTSYTDLMVPDGAYSTSNPTGGQIPTGEQYGVVISKDSPGLTEAINKALHELWEEGKMDDIQTTWFGEVICSEPQA